MESRTHLTDRRGSILLVTLILSLGLAIFLGSYVKLATGTFRMSDRSFFANGCLNLAEAGLEEALYALNNADWTGWTKNGVNMNRTIANVDMGQGATGSIKVRVFEYASDISPRVVAEGRANLNSGPQVIKQIEIVANTKSYWANGMVAKNTITFNGGPTYVDSFDSADPAHSNFGFYDYSKRKDNGHVGSVSVGIGAVSVGNAEIWGYVATGGSAPTVGGSGKIHGADTPAGVDIDPNRIRTDFTANFETIAAPAASFDHIYTDVEGTQVLGALGSTSVIKASAIRNNSGEVTTILGDVTMVVSGEIDVKGAILVEPTSRLTVYVEGDIDIGGSGALNATGLSKNLVIYGTSTTTQTMGIGGSGALAAAIYAPNADLELKGGGGAIAGHFMGSAVANNVVLSGNFKYHYDEDLANLSSTGVYTVGEWRELHGQAQWVNL
jgi:hypothetical protein